MGRFGFCLEWINEHSTIKPGFKPDQLRNYSSSKKPLACSAECVFSKCGNYM